MCDQQQIEEREDQKIDKNENGFELLSLKEIDSDGTIGVIEIIEGNGKSNEGIDADDNKENSVEMHDEDEGKNEEDSDGNDKKEPEENNDHLEVKDKKLVGEEEENSVKNDEEVFTEQTEDLEENIEKNEEDYKKLSIDKIEELKKTEEKYDSEKSSKIMMSDDSVDKSEERNSIELHPVDFDDYDPNFITTKEIYFNIISIILYAINIISHVIVGVEHYSYNIFCSFFTFYFILLTNIYSSNIVEAVSIFEYIVSSSNWVTHWILRVVSMIFSLTPILQHVINIRLINKSLNSSDEAIQIDCYNSYKRIKCVVYKLHEIIRYLGMVPQICLQIFIVALYFKTSRDISAVQVFSIIIAVLYKTWIELHKNETPHFLLDKKWKKLLGAVMISTGNIIPLLSRIVCTSFLLSNNELMKWMVFILYIIHCVISVFYKYRSASEYNRSWLNSMSQGISMSIKPETSSFKSCLAQNIVLQIEDSAMIILWLQTSYDRFSEDQMIHSFWIAETVMFIDVLFRVVQTVYIQIKDHFIGGQPKFALAEL